MNLCVVYAMMMKELLLWVCGLLLRGMFLGGCREVGVVVCLLFFMGPIVEVLGVGGLHQFMSFY